METKIQPDEELKSDIKALSDLRHHIIEIQNLLSFYQKQQKLLQENFNSDKLEIELEEHIKELTSAIEFFQQLKEEYKIRKENGRK